MFITNIPNIQGILPKPQHTSLCFEKIRLDPLIKQLLVQMEATINIEYKGYSDTPFMTVRSIKNGEKLFTLSDFLTLFEYRKMMDETVKAMSTDLENDYKAKAFAQLLPLFKEDGFKPQRKEEKGKIIKLIGDLTNLINNINTFGDLHKCKEGIHIRSQAVILVYDLIEKIAKTSKMEVLNPMKRMDLDLIPAWVKSRFLQKDAFRKDARFQSEILFPKKFSSGFKIRTSELMNDTFLLYHSVIMEDHADFILTARELLKNKYIGNRPEKGWSDEENERINRFEWTLSESPYDIKAALQAKEKCRYDVTYERYDRFDTSGISNFLELLNKFNFTWNALKTLQILNPTRVWRQVFPDEEWPEYYDIGNSPYKIVQNYDEERIEDFLEREGEMREIWIKEIHQELCEVSPEDTLELTECVEKYLSLEKDKVKLETIEPDDGFRKVGAKNKKDGSKSAKERAGDQTRYMNELVFKYNGLLEKEPTDQMKNHARKVLRLKKANTETKYSRIDRTRRENIKSILLTDTREWIKQLGESEFDILIGSEIYLWLENLPCDLLRNVGCGLIHNYLQSRKNKLKEKFGQSEEFDDQEQEFDEE